MFYADTRIFQNRKNRLMYLVDFISAEDLDGPSSQGYDAHYAISFLKSKRLCADEYVEAEQILSNKTVHVFPQIGGMMACRSRPKSIEFAAIPMPTKIFC
jgi:hypothetical protein